MVVHLPAILPDLPPWARNRANVAHLDHRLCKLLEEQLVVLSILLHQFHCRSALGEQDFVRAQQALVGQNVLEVVIIELCGANEVQGEQVLVTAGPRAAFPEKVGVGIVQCRIREPVASLVVEPLAEAGAPRIPNGVASCISTLIRCLDHSYQKKF